VRSSRRLEREARRNVELMWLLRGLAPGCRTIANFRTANAAGLKAANRDFVLLAASICWAAPWWRSTARLPRRCQQGQHPDHEAAARADGGARPQHRGIPCRAGDQRQGGGGSGGRSAGNAALGRGDRAKTSCLAPTAGGGRGRFGKACRKRRWPDLAHRCGRPAAVADAGYYNGETLKACEQAAITAYVPLPDRGPRLKAQGRFSLEDFRYDAGADVYRCPAGAELRPMHGQKRQASGKMAIRYATRRSVCRVCPLRGRCLAGKGARREIERWTDEDVIERHRARMRATGKDMMRRRKALAEHPFGTLKCRAGYRHFLVRGFAKVRAEWRLMALCYNFSRVLRISAPTGGRRCSPSAPAKRSAGLLSRFTRTHSSAAAGPRISAIRLSCPASKRIPPQAAFRLPRS
jgi:hypothetical protein